ncbi:hypothetical protein [Stenomitos frigidus]|uniref:Uncharacterized protein n=1 Tax=Stenomitos frigidus ULC18 TaxID=2107698 RepID=A0A2T1DWN2_9CYAN|nr:hypothetical protein [Stenomitos frigidus]PSB24908.1 hypothetical protein C7B82_25190 [Stenomitos frigidus ULC18]
MRMLRLTASLSVICAPLLLSEMVFSQSVTGQSSYTSPGSNLQTPGSNLQTPGVGSQSPGVGSQSPGVGSQSPGVGSQSPGTAQTTNGQSTNTGQSSLGTAGTTQTINGQPVQISPSTTGTTGSNQTSGSGQAVAPSLPSSTKVPGAEQTFVNGQSTGTTQVAPPLTTGGSTQSPLNGQSTGPSNGTQPSSVLYPPQIIPGSGVAPTAQPPVGPATTNAAPIQPQSTPNTAATRTTPTTPQVTQTPLQAGQGDLDASLQQATCAQNWQQAIRLVNTAIAAAPTSEAGYRAQLVSYRSRLQTLQSKGVRASNWAQQCRSGNLANAPRQ